MNAASQSASPWLGMLALLFVAMFAFAFLRAEQQWQVAALAAVGTIGLLLMGRSNMRRIESSWAAHQSSMQWTAIVLSAIVIFLFREDHFALLMIATVMLFSVACLGLNVQFGYAGVVNFAGAAFLGIGGYTAAMLTARPGIPHGFVILVAGLLAGLIGSLLILPLLRTRGHYAALITIAFAILFRTFLEVSDTFGGPQGLKVSGLRIFGWSFNDNIETPWGGEYSFYLNYVILSFLLLGVAVMLVRRLEYSWLGLSLDAVRIDETAASVFGFDVARWKIVAFTLGNALAGVAGAVYAMMTGFVAPANFTLAESLILVSIVILGGVGNPIGILPAAALVLILPEKLQAIQEYRYLLFSLFVILVLLFRPEGLLPRRMRVYAPRWRSP
ncbi:MAG TPA: branched-chain amino acid ABC transporter permease [Burkholderiales bacterium]|nr:branched-chain amino acid ABC transporter permease [Burkholderiales bacterium]